MIHRQYLDAVTKIQTKLITCSCEEKKKPRLLLFFFYQTHQKKTLLCSTVRCNMTEFWKEHSKDATVEEMMLDSRAKELTQQELPEILSVLPCLTGSRVLELGAGIGWAQSRISPWAVVDVCERGCQGLHWVQEPVTKDMRVTDEIQIYMQEVKKVLWKSKWWAQVFLFVWLIFVIATVMHLKQSEREKCKRGFGIREKSLLPFKKSVQNQFFDNDQMLILWGNIKKSFIWFSIFSFLTEEHFMNVAAQV